MRGSKQALGLHRSSLLRILVVVLQLRFLLGIATPKRRMFTINRAAILGMTTILAYRIPSSLRTPAAMRASDIALSTEVHNLKEKLELLKWQLNQMRELEESFVLPDADEDIEKMFDGFCTGSRHDDAVHSNSRCVLQNAFVDPASKIDDCRPFSGGDNTIFGLKWCAWSPSEDRHISSFLLENKMPIHEEGPMNDFLASISNSNKRGIVIDAGAQVGLFSAAALSAGHYTISIDARQEHVQMNMVSRAINKFNESDGMVVHGALSDRCGQWATIPRQLQESENPGSTHIVGRVSEGYPIFRSREEFYELNKVPVLTLDRIMEHALYILPAGVERKVYALKIDIEGYEPRAIMGSRKLFTHLKPEIIVMELFVHRFSDCDAKQLITAIAKLGYSIDVSPRLNLVIRGARKDILYGSRDFSDFMQMLRPNSEMDLIFRATNVTADSPASAQLLTRNVNTTSKSASWLLK